MYSTEVKYITLLVVLTDVGVDRPTYVKVICLMRIVGRRQVTVRFMN